MINHIPRRSDEIVVYRGRVAENVTGAGFGVWALIVDGVQVPYRELDAWYSRRMLVDWRGQPFSLDRYQDGLVYGGYAGVDSVWARENGLMGDQYEGWFLNGAPEREIENLRVETSDILQNQLYRQTFKANPPKGLFVTVRPATDQEWIREQH